MFGWTAYSKAPSVTLFQQMLHATDKFVVYLL
jgi:hypothetical protein